MLSRKFSSTEVSRRLEEAERPNEITTGMRLKENDQRIYYSHTGNITPTWSKLTREIKISGRVCKTRKKTSCKRTRQYVSSTFRLCFKGGLYAAREISDVVTLTRGFSQSIPVFFLLKSYQWRQRVRQLSVLLFRVKTLGKKFSFSPFKSNEFQWCKKESTFWTTPYVSSVYEAATSLERAKTKQQRQQQIAREVWT